ncbi:MAG TPA: enoyl-CoA hydratase-related protein [Dehalococcoidia bacterium]|nr:enoyl-CoA hydratase-related protein [Dehalococcoidia bacterium]
MAYELIKYEQDDKIVTITINRPERMNSIHPPTTAELADAWNTFKNDDSAWIAILTGAGDRAFSAGNDLKYTAEASRGDHAGERFAPVAGGFGGITADFECWKPMIAAVNGFALGGGCEMALACDIVVAADHARLGLPEPRVGLLAGAGGVHRLPRHIPLKVAMGYMLTAKHMTAQDALKWGLINEVVPKEELMTAARRWAAEILECAPLSIRATKEATYKGLEMGLDAAITHSFHGQRVMGQSLDTIEGPRAFAEKRDPNWQAK